MEGVRQPPAVASAAVSKVLDADDLLIEILLRVGFPTTLVRAALVCKRWFHQASDTGFLRRFRELHPPHVLGFYMAHKAALVAPRFVPMLPQPPDLDAAIRYTRFCLDTWQSAITGIYIMDCRNGSFFTEHRGRTGYYTLGVHKPMCPERSMVAVQPLPKCQPKVDIEYVLGYLLSKEHGTDVSYYYMLIQCTKERTKFMAHIYMLQDGAWRTQHTIAIDQPSLPLWRLTAVLVDNKIYIMSAPENITVLDLTASSFFTIQLPHGVEYDNKDTMLSRTHDASGVYLIKARELEVRVWANKGENWLLVDTICLREMCDNLSISYCKDDHLQIYHVGDNADFLFFQISRYVLYLDVKCRKLRKVHEMPTNDVASRYHIYPLKMIWPPTFPALINAPARNVL